METPWSPRLRPLTIGLLIVGTAWAFESLAVATILPEASLELGGLNLYGWAFSAFLLANLLTVSIAGSEVDRVGPVIPFSLGILFFIAGLLCASFAPTMPALVAARAVQGIGSGFLSAVSFAVIGGAFPDSARPRMLALMSTAWVIPGLGGPAVAGIIGELVGWRWVFAGVIPFPIIAAFIAGPALRRLPPGKGGKPDTQRFLGSAALAAGLGLLLAGLTQETLPLLALLSIVGLVLLGFALPRVLTPEALRVVPGAPAAVLTMILLSIGFFAVEPFIPLLLTELRGGSIAFGGLPLTAAAMTWTTGSWIVERKAATANRGVVARIGFLLLAVGVGLIAAVVQPSVPPVVALLAWAFAGLGMGLAFTSMQLVTMEQSPPETLGRATSTLQLVHTAAIALAAGVGGALVAKVSPLSQALLLQDALAVIALALGFVAAGRLTPSREERPKAATAP
ncbi:MAG: MFS transporter [Thermomicrobiales bacterium]